jgi:hypothetical protein
MDKHESGTADVAHRDTPPTISATRVALLEEAMRVGADFNSWSADRAKLGKPLMRIVVRLTGSHQSQLDAHWIELYYTAGGQMRNNYITKGGMNYDVEKLQAACKIRSHRRRLGEAESQLAVIRAQLRELDKVEGLGRWVRRGRGPRCKQNEPS